MSNELLVPKPSSPSVPSVPPAAAPAAPRPKPVKLGFFGGVSDQDKIDFARHLAIIIKAGIPLYDGLVILKKQSQSPRSSRSSINCRGMFRTDFFSLTAWSIITRCSAIFFISVVRVGEASGTLAQNLLYLSDETKKRRNLKRKIKSAMVYPIVILVMTLGVTAFLAFFVFPKLLPALTSSGGKLPGSTLLLISAIGFVTSYGLVSLGVIIALVFLSVISFITWNRSAMSCTALSSSLPRFRISLSA